MNDRWKNPELQKLDLLTSVLMIIVVTGSIFAMLMPKSMTMIVLVIRTSICISLCLNILYRFEDKNIENRPANI